MTPYQLKTPEEIKNFIDALNEKPEHTVSIHQLRNDLANVWIIGKPDDFQAAVVRWTGLPEFPIAFGDDADTIWQILSTLENWVRIQVSESVAPHLLTLIQDNLEVPVTQSTFIYFMHETPVNLPAHDDTVTIRILTEADFDMVKSMPGDEQPIVLSTLEDTLRHEIIGGAIVDKVLVGFSESRAADKHVELGVYVNEAWRKKGIASAMAGLLIQHFQQTGLKIIWGTDEDNLASRRVAEKVGFQEISRRVFLIPQQEE